MNTPLRTLWSRADHVEAPGTYGFSRNAGQQIVFLSYDAPQSTYILKLDFSFVSETKKAHLNSVLDIGRITASPISGPRRPCTLLAHLVHPPDVQLHRNISFRLCYITLLNLSSLFSNILRPSLVFTPRCIIYKNPAGLRHPAFFSFFRFVSHAPQFRKFQHALQQRLDVFQQQIKARTLRVLSIVTIVTSDLPKFQHSTIPQTPRHPFF